MSNERILVKIRTVSSLLPIPNADMIEIAVVDGWKVVVKKGEFKIGDSGLYFEIDSFLPFEDSRFEFLQKSGVREYEIPGRGILKGMVLRTVRLRKQLSQGLLLPLTSFPELDLSENDDTPSLQDQLNVVLYERKIPKEIFDKVIGFIPSFLKTKQERIQNISIEDLGIYSQFEITEKLDGESMTVFLKEDQSVGVCMRNYELKQDSLFWPTALSYGLDKILKETFENSGYQLAFQGELFPHYGKNKFFIFDIVDMKTQTKLLPEERALILNMFPQLDAVPVIGFHTISHFITDCEITVTVVDQILHTAGGMSIMGHFQREGLVFKSMVDPNLSFKVISNSFLEKEIK